MSKGSVVIVGSGIMGVGITALFMNAGWRVQLLVRNTQVWQRVRDQVTGLLDRRDGPTISGELKAAASLAEIDWEGIDLVIETVLEDLDIKRQIFGELDLLVPAGIPIASNTSSLRITDIAEACSTRERMAHAHFFMPAHLVPLVELAKAAFTSDEVIEKMHALFTAIGRVPVTISQDVPGLLANRIQHALMREAWSVVQQGLATPDDVDKAVRFGFGFRFVAAGPFMQKELSGLDTQMASAAATYPSLCNDTKPAAILREAVAAGHFGAKSGQGLSAWPQERVRLERARYERTLAAATQLLALDDHLAFTSAQTGSQPPKRD